jgi:O-antigen ligase
MENIFNKIDLLAGIETEQKLARWLERLAFVFLVLMTLAAPHSIAATQIAWLLGMVFCIARAFLKPRPKFIKTALFIPFALFFLWSVISAVFSYAPDISIDKLRNVSLFIIFFFAISNLRTIRAVRFIAFALIFSCMINVIWTPIVRLIGRGVEIQNVKETSPLYKSRLRSGDTILKANDRKVTKPEDILAEFEINEIVRINFYRPDFYVTKEVRKSDLLAGDNASEKLGFDGWKVSRNWRSTGFYGHYATYAEVLQLIASLALGLFIAIFGKSPEPEVRSPKSGRDSSEFGVQSSEFGRKMGEGRQGEEDSLYSKLSTLASPFLLFFCIALIALSLLLTVTRASQLAFLISAFSIVLLGASRKLVLILVAIVIPVGIGGLIFLQQARNVGFLDSKDSSTTWRQTVYREGFDLWTDNPRHFLIGVGMDSIKRYKEEWGLFDNGKLPSGHFHSTPLQLVVERGLPALLFWLWIIGVYLLKMFKFLRAREFKDRIEKGIVLGAFGGAIGFFVSGLVHYNLGDGEVAMVFYLIMALAMTLVGCRSAGDPPAQTRERLNDIYNL